MRPFLRFSQYYKGSGPSTISIFIDGRDTNPFTEDDATYGPPMPIMTMLTLSWVRGKAHGWSPTANPPSSLREATLST